MEKIELNPQPLPPEGKVTLDLEGLVDKQEELAIKVIEIDAIIANLETQIQAIKNSIKAAEGVRDTLKAKIKLNKK
jgi:outer membrane murein-binding lipoprotein Lpp